MALPHRLQKGPFSEANISAQELQEKIDGLIGKQTESEMTEKTEAELSEAEKKI